MQFRPVRIPGEMTGWVYWRGAVLISLPFMLGGIYFLSNGTIFNWLYLGSLLTQGAWLAYWWSRRKKLSP
jgi:hypothetical protein